MKIALVIPTYKPHYMYLERLCKNAAEQTRLPNLVIIRASSCDTEEAGAQLADISHKPWPFPLLILDTPLSQCQALNRNEGAAAVPSEFDIISFFDSDDLMHPRRLELIERPFLEGAEAVLHGYTKGNSVPSWEVYDGSVSHVWDSILLQKESAIQIGNQIVSRSVIIQEYPDGINIGKEITFLRPISMDESLEENILGHYGHISILRRIFDTIQYNEEALGYEDAQFLSDILYHRHRTATIRADLSYYMLH